MLTIPTPIYEQADRYYRRVLSRLPRLDFSNGWHVRFVRLLAACQAAAPRRARKLGLRVSEEMVSAGGRATRVRFVAPASPCIGIVVDIHGGFWTALQASNDDSLTFPLALDGFVVIGVEYRHAPETPLESVIEDCETALLWAMTEGRARFNCDRVCLHGDSAGAHLALCAATSQLARCGGPAHLCGLVLFYGCYDLSGTASVRAAPRSTLFVYGPGLEATLRKMTGGLGSASRTDPRISPLYRDLHGLPPTLLIVGDADPMLEDSQRLAALLQAAGVQTELAVIERAPHAFNRLPTEVAKVTNAYARDWMRDRLCSVSALPNASSGDHARSTF